MAMMFQLIPLLWLILMLATPSKENPTERYTVHIVQKWEPLATAPMAELTINGKSQGTVKVDWQVWVEWNGIPFSPGAQGRVVPSASNNITFSIVSGPGRIIGVGQTKLHGGVLTTD